MRFGGAGSRPLLTNLLSAPLLTRAPSGWPARSCVPASGVNLIAILSVALSLLCILSRLEGSGLAEVSRSDSCPLAPPCGTGAISHDEGASPPNLSDLVMFPRTPPCAPTVSTPPFGPLAASLGSLNRAGLSWRNAERPGEAEFGDRSRNWGDPLSFFSGLGVSWFAMLLNLRGHPPNCGLGGSASVWGGGSPVSKGAQGPPREILYEKSGELGGARGLLLLGALTGDAKNSWRGKRYRLRRLQTVYKCQSAYLVRQNPRQYPSV